MGERALKRIALVRKITMYMGNRRTTDGRQRVSTLELELSIKANIQSDRKSEEALKTNKDDLRNQSGLKELAVEPESNYRAKWITA